MRFLPALLAIALVAPPQGLGAESASLGYFPEDTLVFATVPDVEALRAEWEASSLGALQEDPRFEEFLEDFRFKLESFSTSVGLSSAELWELVEGGVALGLVRTAEGELGLIGVAEVASEQGQAEQVMAEMESRLEAAGGEKLTLQAGDRQFTSWTANYKGQRQSFSYALQDARLVLSNTLPAVMEAVKRQQDPEARSFANSQAYRYVMQQVGAGSKEATVRWFVDPVKLLDAAVSSNLQGSPQLPMLRGVIPLSGLNQLKGIGGTANLAHGEFDSVVRTFGYVQQPAHGLLQALKMPATSQEPPAWVTEDVSLYAQINWSAPQLYGTVSEVFENFQGPGSFDQTVGAMKLGQTDLELKKDLVNQLVGPVHIVAEIPGQADDLFSQPTVFAVEVRDPVQLSQTLRELAESAEAGSSDIQGTAVHELSVQYPLTGQTLTLGAAVSEGALMFSSSASYLRQLIRESGQKRPLAESSAYQQIAEQFPPKTSMISYQRQDNRLETVYERLRAGGLQGMPTMGVDFTALPPFEAMRPYLQSSGSYIEPAENGFRMVQFALPPREQ